MFCFVFCLCYKFLEDLYIKIFVREIYRKIQTSYMYSNSSIYKGIYLQMEINVFAIFSPKHLQMDACGRKLRQIHTSIISWMTTLWANRSYICFSKNNKNDVVLLLANCHNLYDNTTHVHEHLYVHVYIFS